MQSANNKYSLNINGKLLHLHTPVVMGIVNVTPDSFYSINITTNAALNTIEQQLEEGATIIDIGGASSKPNAVIVTEHEELSRVLPVVQQAVKLFPNIIISVDTTSASVAKAVLDLGASCINDISAGRNDAKMFATVAQYGCPYILMHAQGTPSTMQNNPKYDNVTTEVFQFFTERLSLAREAGINDIIIDVGFGFGKTVTHNYELLNNLTHFNNLGVPLLVGVSRKSMLYKLVDTTPENALNVTIVANTIALMNGANILRVHDVKAAIEAIKVVGAMRN
ncbi:MAG: dihydropteroate synthase [Bacteroidia bacterium]|nr:dihydropteroate synthase [Bacteroidia bacterium]